MFFPSLARQRLYTTVSLYGSILRDVGLDRIHEGDDLAKMESELKSRLDVPYVLPINQGRIGLHLAIKASLTEKKKRVIMSPFTIFDVVNMVIAAGAQPVFADIEPGSCTIDPNQVERLMSEDVAAVMVTHTHVMVQGWERIAELCRKRNVALIEDAAVAYGTKHRGRSVGTLGTAGVYSFGLFKNVSAVFGGALVTHDEKLYRRAAEEVKSYHQISRQELVRRLFYGLQIDVATHPMVFRALTFWVFRYGFLHDIELINKRTRNDPNPLLRTEIPESMKLQLSQAQARLINAQLDNVDHHARERMNLVRIYHQGLSDVPGVRLPPYQEDGTAAYLVYPIQVEDRPRMLQHLMTVGRDTASYYYRNTADLDCFEKWRRDCPNARAANEQIILLPTYPGYGEDEAHKNVEAVRAFFGFARRSTVASPSPTSSPS